MSILDEIVAHKRKEVENNKSLYPVKLLEKGVYFEGKPVSMVEYLRREDKQGIIAEIKRKSPSKGIINSHVSVEKISIGYMQAGASGLSILTDKNYFGGSSKDLIEARSFNYCPILRKDFVIDEYQIIEAKSIGADIILLIAAILSAQEIKAYTSLAQSLGMQVLLEVHSEEELQSCLDIEVDLLGVNNRDLNTFKTDIDTSRQLAKLIPDEFVKVSESGISDPSIVKELKEYGYEGFLMGEHFMQSGQPEKACRNFIRKLKSIT